MPTMNLTLHANAVDAARILNAYGRVHFPAENRAATEAEFFAIIVAGIQNTTQGYERHAAEAALASPAPLTIT